MQAQQLIGACLHRGHIKGRIHPPHGACIKRQRCATCRDLEKIAPLGRGKT